MKSIFFIIFLIFSSSALATANLSFPIKKLDITYDNDLRVRAEVTGEKIVFMKIDLKKLTFSLPKKMIDYIADPDFRTLNIYSGSSGKSTLIIVDLDSFDDENGRVTRYKIEFSNYKDPVISANRIP